MCKFCDSNKEKYVLSYNNHSSMNIYCGQYQGVYVNADLKMKGNMLMLSGKGSYRSRTNCYYEDEGLDCDDDEEAKTSPAKCIKVEYCPFCGKKLESTEFEKKQTKQMINSITNKLKTTKKKNTLYAKFTFIAKGDIYEKAKNMVWEKHNDGSNTTYIPVKLETILKEFGNLKCRLIYGNNTYYEPIPFDPNKGVQFSMVRFNEFQGPPYIITGEQYGILADMGLVKKDNNKVTKMKEKQRKCQEEIQKMENKLEELKAYFKTL